MSRIKDGSYIILNTKLSSDPILHICTLAEEIGHHLTMAQSNILIDNTAAARIRIQIDEYKAKLWAVNFLVPREEFLNVLRALGNPSIEELAGYFNVTIDFIRIRFQFSK